MIIKDFLKEKTEIKQNFKDMERTKHIIYYKSAEKMDKIEDNSVALVVTSPPYPMIEMWDEIFSTQNKKIETSLEQKDGLRAFENMHLELDMVWKELYRVLIPGGIVCINIGDATRTIGKNFQLFPSHARIINSFTKIGFQSLPEIIWRKPTNAPNKFMGSGMLPPGAYVTLEHEYILIFRKGKKREFPNNNDKELRRESAYFWEERNSWFSDIWEFKGILQNISSSKKNNSRNRSAAFPFELAYRLINMFSIKHDFILDPFLGTGTTTMAAMISQRNSIGFEIEQNLSNVIEEKLSNVITFGNDYIRKRISNHISFINKRIKEKGQPKYTNLYHDFPVITSQEQKIKINKLKSIEQTNQNEFIIYYN